MGADFIFIPDENGDETKYEIFAEVNHEGKDYIFVFEEGKEQDMYCFAVEEEEGGFLQLTAIQGDDFIVMQQILDTIIDGMDEVGE